MEGELELYLKNPNGHLVPVRIELLNNERKGGDIVLQIKPRNDIPTTVKSQNYIQHSHMNVNHVEPQRVQIPYNSCTKSSVESQRQQNQYCRNGSCCDKEDARYLDNHQREMQDSKTMSAQSGWTNKNAVIPMSHQNAERQNIGNHVQEQRMFVSESNGPQIQSDLAEFRVYRNAPQMFVSSQMAENHPVQDIVHQSHSNPVQQLQSQAVNNVQERQSRDVHHDDHEDENNVLRQRIEALERQLQMRCGRA